jgi:predicted TIM-barrel fold metal-dependent hydrolase
MKVIDVHTHFGVSVFDGIGTGDVDKFVENLEKRNIAKAVIFAVDSGEVNDSYFNQNNLVLEAAKKHPNKLIPFGRIKPGNENAFNEMNRLWNLGVKGFKFHPSTDKFKPPELDTLFSKLNFNPIIIFHAWHSNISKPSLWEDLIIKFPNFTFIIGHAGRDKVAQASKLANKYDNVYVEISTNSLNRIRRFFNGSTKYSPIRIDRILYGSDFPYEFFDDNIEKVQFLLDENNAKKVLSENAKALFLRHGVNI